MDAATFRGLAICSIVPEALPVAVWMMGLEEAGIE